MIHKADLTQNCSRGTGAVLPASAMASNAGPLWKVHMQCVRLTTNCLLRFVHEKIINRSTTRKNLLVVTGLAGWHAHTL